MILIVKGRQIFYGILVANEIVDEARQSKKELLLFKVDFEKAYDSIDLDYLDDVMVKMGFPALWRKWVKECTGTASASSLVNGSPTDEFYLGRGLRQGDPISPFLCQKIICLVVTRWVVVSHLHFADDTLILGEKTWANIRSMRVALLLFQAMFGLKVNFAKSQLVGMNVPVSWLSEAALVLNCKVGTIPFVYLGLPIGGNVRRLAFWDPITNHIKSTLSGWKSRHLSLGGRLLLLKYVMSSLPVCSSKEVGGKEN